MTDALRSAVARAGPALAALVLAALAAFVALVGELAMLARGVLLLVVSSASALVRVVIAGTLVASVMWAWPIAWRAFGGDVAAMIPASMLSVLPVAWMLAKRAGWPGLLAAVIAIAGLALVLPAMTHPVLLAFVVLVAMFVHFTTRRLHHV